MVQDYNDYEASISAEAPMGATKYAISIGRYQGVNLYPSDVEVSDINWLMATSTIYIGPDPLDAIDNYADYVDYHEGKIVRTVLKYTFTGAEVFWRVIGKSVEIFASRIAPNIVPNSNVRSYSPDGDVLFQNVTYGGPPIIRISVAGISDAADIKPYLKSLYDTGTPAVMWYASSEPVEVDPPVPLPALPTVDGTNIVDYAGQSTAIPSRFTAKYRKEGF